MTRDRVFPNVVVRRRSPNQSVRSPGGVQLIVIHDTESHNRPGRSDLEAIGNWFAQTAAQASSHVCTDGDGNSARYVADAAKAWHCGAFNSVSLGIEQIGFSHEGAAAWRNRHKQVDETARWCAYWSMKYGVPLRWGAVSGYGVVRSGLIYHRQLGVAGGNHGDPGLYPRRYLLARARQFKVQMRKRR